MYKKLSLIIFYIVLMISFSYSQNNIITPPLPSQEHTPLVEITVEKTPSAMLKTVADATGLEINKILKYRKLGLSFNDIVKLSEFAKGKNLKIEELLFLTPSDKDFKELAKMLNIKLPEENKDITLLETITTLKLKQPEITDKASSLPQIPLPEKSSELAKDTSTSSQIELPKGELPPLTIPLIPPVGISSDSSPLFPK